MLVHTWVALHESFGQHFKILTSYKPFGKRWVTKDQYIQFFTVCSQVLHTVADDTNHRNSRELRALLEVWKQLGHSGCAFDLIHLTLEGHIGIVYGSSQAEWERDSQGLPAMTFIVFFHAVFEAIGAHDSS